MSKSRQAKAPRPAPRRDEVLVIGSGAVGAACAAALARAGHRVRILSMPGRSTTAVSGGHLLLQTKLPGPRLDLARRSQELIAAAAAGQEEELGYRRTGSLLLAASEDEELALRAHFDLLSGAGVDLQWLDGDAARALEPLVAPEIRAASFCPSDAQVDPAALAGHFLQEAVMHRASVTSNAPVESFVRTWGKLTGVVAGGLEYPASAVVLAAGPWSGELARMAGLELGMRSRRGVYLRSYIEKALAGRPLLGASYLRAKFDAEVDLPSSAAFSFQQHPDGRCLLGATRDFVEWSTDGLVEAAAAIRTEARRYLPALDGLEWEPPGAGYRPWMPGGEFQIGPSEVAGIHLCCGFEGDGITLAAAAAELLVARI